MSISLQNKDFIAFRADLSLSYSEILNFESSSKEGMYRYIITEIKSAATQRNLGVVNSNLEDVQFLLFLDDDTRPSSDYVPRLMNVLKSTQEVVGCSGVTLPRAKPYSGWKSLYYRLFLISGNKGGRLLKSGTNVPVLYNQNGIFKVDWLFGCAMWRTEIFNHVMYSDNLPGGALGDDVIFSTRAGFYGDLFVDTGAVLDHFLSPTNRPSPHVSECRNVRNRYEVVKQLNGYLVPRLAFWWFIVGYSGLLNYKTLISFLGSAGNRKVAISIYAGFVHGIFLVLSRKQPI